MKKKNLLVSGLALFAMFFGAGNLIFPPYLGLMSGTSWPLALLGFIGIEVVMSCLGIYALFYAGDGPEAISNAVGAKAGLLLNTAAIFLTGIIIAAPRTAATTYEMLVKPINSHIPLWAFSIIFFVVVYLLTRKQTSLVDIIGRFLTPVLTICILALIIIGIVSPNGHSHQPITDHLMEMSIQTGYQAMDIISVAGFSLVLGQNFTQMGLTSRKERLKAAGGTCFIAGLLLAAIYAGLCFLGANLAAPGLKDVSQAALLVSITSQLLGSWGVRLLGIITACACLTTCVGLFGATASYIEELSHGKIKYGKAIIGITIINFLICNLGLTNIIRFASPILAIIVPPLMVIVVLLLASSHIHSSAIYQGAALGAFIGGFFVMLHDSFKLLAPLSHLPLYNYGFGWISFAIIGGLCGVLLTKLKRT
ncbi:MAG: branched-chain amino acid transport system II carrier protein [Intestinibaculum porci]|uniref:branched-chain amino acid transport system II carrier protein n=1 Tax=Intestinibaculum porci TaxID=2487118 RepID=UPI003EFC642A